MVGVPKKIELLYDGVYYDVTNWVKRHPGGGVIDLYTSTGEDSIHAVQQFHKRSTKKVMSLMNALPQRGASEEDAIINPEKQKKHSALTEDFLELFQQLEAEGLFKPSLFHVFTRLLELFCLVPLGLYFAVIIPQNIIMRTIGVCILTLAIGRSGWVQHEGGHHSLTGKPKIDRFIQVLIYGLFYGLSGSRWISQHSRHHAMPQNLKYDVDIHTTPFVAFHKKVVKNPEEGKGFFLQNQKWLAMSFGMVSLTLYWKFILHPHYCLIKKKYFDIICMALHYTLLFQIGVLNYSAILFLGSFYQIGNIILSHTHLPVTDEPTHWVEYSLCHTANIRSSWWVDYWMGYLNYQIEHHLFPTMPQYKNKLCRDRVKALARKHNLPYNLMDYGEAWIKTIENLGTVSKELALEF